MIYISLFSLATTINNYFIMLIYSPGLADLMLDSGLLLAEMPPAVSDLRSNACTLAGHRAMVGGLV